MIVRYIHCCTHLGQEWVVSFSSLTFLDHTFAKCSNYLSHLLSVGDMYRKRWRHVQNLEAFILEALAGFVYPRSSKAR